MAKERYFDRHVGKRRLVPHVPFEDRVTEVVAPIIAQEVEDYLIANQPAGGLNINQIKADLDIVDAITKKHTIGSDDQDLTGLQPKETGKGLSTNDYTTAEQVKLAGIADNANNYAHPSSHAPSVITQDSNNRFVTDAEKATWNASGGLTQQKILRLI